MRLLALLLALLAFPARAGDVQVVDGDTIRIAGHSFRLHGIDAPERSQTCSNGWLAGEYATAVLRGLVDGKMVLCIPRDTDRYGRTVARCLADGEDVGAEMVRMGMALAFRRYSDDYVLQEMEARANKLGIHAQACQAPWDYRAEKRR